MQEVMVVKNVRKVFGQAEVLKDVSFSIHKGEIFGFLGRNGAGKSTLINILTGVIHKTSGEIRVLNQPIEKVKHKIGVFPDIDTFYSEWNAMQHLHFFAKVQKVSVTKKQMEEQLEAVGLLKDKAKKVKYFSFGMKKKLGVAQALLGKPEFIILDEPTSGLDPESAISMRELITKIAAQGTTIFVTSHNLHELEKISHRIAILKEGKISALGTMEQLRATIQTKKRVDLTLNRPLENMDLIQLTVPYQVHQQFLSIFIEKQSEIGACIRQLVLGGYDVYKVDHHEKSLEEIFLQGESSS